VFIYKYNIHIHMYIYMYIYMLYTNDITIYACMYIDISDAYKHRASSLP